MPFAEMSMEPKSWLQPDLVISSPGLSLGLNLDPEHLGFQLVKQKD